MSAMVRLGGLWMKRKQSGEIYYSGRFGSGRLLIFKNNKKRGDNDPDLVVMVGEDQPREQQPERPAEPDPLDGPMPW